MNSEIYESKIHEPRCADGNIADYVRQRATEKIFHYRTKSAGSEYVMKFIYKVAMLLT